MQPSRPAGLCAALLLLLVASAAAESVRETETMGPQLYTEEFSSGDLPDDEDSRPDFIIEDEDSFSGSGDEEGYTDNDGALTSAPDNPMVSVDNNIPDSNKGIKDKIEPAIVENEIIPNRVGPPEGEDLSNKIPMASTANGSIFERTEVLAALIAGGAVGLLFAVFLIFFLVYRMKKKDEGSYDLGKKPIYKKAPTNEFYA